MSTVQKRRFTPYVIVTIGLMAALCWVSNYIRIPFLESKITVANAVCLLCGLLLGPVSGFLAAGLGSMIYDLTAGYGAECLITLVSKGAIALVAGLVAGRLLYAPAVGKKEQTRLVIGCVLGALTYVALYMLKTFIFGFTVYGLNMEGTLAKMGLKLPASMINAVFAFIAAPLLFNVLRPALRHAGVLRKNA